MTALMMIGGQIECILCIGRGLLRAAGAKSRGKMRENFFFFSISYLLNLLIFMKKAK